MLPYLYESSSFTIGSYGLLLAIAYLTGRWYFLSTLEKAVKPTQNLEVLIILLLISGVVGAKLMFILKNPEKAQLLLSGTGFSSQGAIIGAIIATWGFSYFSKFKLNYLLDYAAPAAILAYALARLGCFLSGDDCYGVPSDLPWAMSFPHGIAATSEKVHPVPLYEIAYSIPLFIFLAKRQMRQFKPYSQFFLLLGLWGACRFLVDFVSTNKQLLWGLTGSQIGALLMVIASLTFWLRQKQNLS